MSSTTRGSPQFAAEKVFVRSSSGLVRELGVRDALVLNFGWTGATFSISFAFMLSQALWAYPGADFGLAQLLTMLLLVPGTALAYALLSIVMPRAGGEYVYISRALHPLLGFLANWGNMVMLNFFVAWGAYWGGSQALSAVFATLGHTLNSSWLLQASTWIAGKPGSFIVALAIILLYGLAVVGGIRFFARLNLIMVALGLVGTIAALAVFLFVNHATFVHNFNAFMTSFTKDPNYYGTVIRRAHAGGVHWSGFSFGATIGILPIVAFSSLFAFGSAYVGSEVRQPRRVQLISVPAALVVLGVLNILIYYVVRRMAGYDFLVAINSDYYNGTLNELPVPPFFNLFATVATGNAIVAILTGLGYLMMSILFLPMNLLLCTRMVFAWSFDRILPSKFADVDERFHSPLWAIAACVAIAVGFLVIIIYTTWLATLSGIAGVLPAIILACIVAAILPRAKPALYHASGIERLRIGPVPLITVAGIVGAVYGTIILIAYLVDNRYLVNSATSLEWIAGIFVVGLVIFLVAWAIRRAQGLDLKQAYREIPPA